MSDVESTDGAVIEEKPVEKPVDIKPEDIPRNSRRFFIQEKLAEFGLVYEGNRRKFLKKFNAQSAEIYASLPQGFYANIESFRASIRASTLTKKAHTKKTVPEIKPKVYKNGGLIVKLYQDLVANGCIDAKFQEDNGFCESQDSGNIAYVVGMFIDMREAQVRKLKLYQEIINKLK